MTEPLKLKKITRQSISTSVYIWINKDTLNIVFSDRSGEEFFKMKYLLTDGRSIHDVRIQETIRNIINRHLPKQAHIQITFWKVPNSKQQISPSKTELKFQKNIVNFIRHRIVEKRIELIVN